MITTNCQNCKMKCNLQIDDSSYSIKVKGNRCTKGINYAENYIYNYSKPTFDKLPLKKQLLRALVGLAIVVLIGIIIYFI